jgi:hypothetical protein
MNMNRSMALSASVLAALLLSGIAPAMAGNVPTTKGSQVLRVMGRGIVLNDGSIINYCPKAVGEGYHYGKLTGAFVGEGKWMQLADGEVDWINGNQQHYTPDPSAPGHWRMSQNNGNYTVTSVKAADCSE